MKDETFIKEMIAMVDGIAAYLPDKAEQYRDEELRLVYQYINRMFDVVSRYREYVSVGPSTTRDRHVGESDYSEKEIQPWDMWIEYALNPWDADIQKRLIRTKHIPGMTAAESRIQDYEKMKHICDERIDQIKAGEPWYQKFKIPAWVEREENYGLAYGLGVDLDAVQEENKMLREELRKRGVIVGEKIDGQD